VIVVGAGIAGLSAARILMDAGCSVVVLEARDRVGGRTLNRTIGNGVFDMGGQFVSPDQQNVARVAREFGLELVPMFHDGRKIQDLAGDVSTYSLPVPMPSLWKPFPFANLLSLALLVVPLELYRMGVPLSRPWLTRRALQWDSISVETWRRQRLISTAAARGVLDPILRTALGAEASEVSMLNMLFFVQSSGGLMGSNKALTYRFGYGSQSMSLKLAEVLGERVVLETPVRAIRHDDSGVTVETDAGSWSGRYAIVTPPVPLSARIRYEPPLPGLRDGLAERMPMASEVKIFATYDRPFWREAGLSGQVVTDSGPLSVVYDNTTPNGQAALLGLIGGRNAHDWGERSVHERRSAVLGQLARYFGPAALAPTDYGEQDWRAEEWSRGCPLAIMSPAAWMSFGPALRTPCGRVHWAGSELAPEWCTFMDGAIASGEQTAKDVLRLLADGGSPPVTGVPGAGSGVAPPTPLEEDRMRNRIDEPGLARASVVLFIVFAGVYSLADRVWVELGVLVYPTVAPGQQPMWVPLLLGSAGLAFVLTHRVLSRWLLAETTEPPRSAALEVAIGAAWFTAAHLGGALFGDAAPALYLGLLALTWFIRVLLARRPFGEFAFIVGYSVALAIGGAAGESVLTMIGLMNYPQGELFGVPLWLPGIWLHAALFSRAISRAWFGGR
jgi:monoamine oxidase